MLEAEPAPVMGAAAPSIATIVPAGNWTNQATSASRPNCRRISTRPKPSSTRTAKTDFARSTDRYSIHFGLPLSLDCRRQSQSWHIDAEPLRRRELGKSLFTRSSGLPMSVCATIIRLRRQPLNSSVRCYRG
jgi:hypothetical protein